MRIQTLKNLLPTSLRMRLLIVLSVAVLLCLVGGFLAIRLLVADTVGDYLDSETDSDIVSVADLIVDAYYRSDADFEQVLNSVNRLRRDSFLIIDNTPEGRINSANSINIPQEYWGTILDAVNVVAPDIEIVDEVALPSEIVENLLVARGSTNFAIPPQAVADPEIEAFADNRALELPNATSSEATLLTAGEFTTGRQFVPLTSVVFLGQTADDSRVVIFDTARQRARLHTIGDNAPAIALPKDGDLSNNLLIQIAIAIAAVGVVVFIIVLLSTGFIFKPIRDLTSATEAFGRGNFAERVKEGGVKEVRNLSRTFNRMATNLQDADKLRRQLTADVAHELRTPLTNLKGYLEAIKDKVIEPRDDVISDMQSQAEHLNKIVDDVALVATADSGELSINFEDGDIAELLKEVVRGFQPVAKAAGVSLKYAGADALQFRFDAVRMRQIVNNLVSNAITHTPKRGKITVGGDFGTDGTLEIKVSDNGKGIAPEHLEHIMERFYRIDPSRSRLTGGSGLGLTIVKKLTELHGGTVAVASEVKRGSTFTITLPAQSE